MNAKEARAITDKNSYADYAFNLVLEQIKDAAYKGNDSLTYYTTGSTTISPEQKGRLIMLLEDEGYEAKAFPFGVHVRW